MANVWGVYARCFGGVVGGFLGYSVGLLCNHKKKIPVPPVWLNMKYIISMALAISPTRSGDIRK